MSLWQMPATVATTHGSEETRRVCRKGFEDAKDLEGRKLPDTNPG